MSEKKHNIKIPLQKEVTFDQLVTAMLEPTPRTHKERVRELWAYKAPKRTIHQRMVDRFWPAFDPLKDQRSELKKALTEKIKEYERFLKDPRHNSEMEQNAIMCVLKELRYLDSIAEIVNT